MRHRIYLSKCRYAAGALSLSFLCLSAAVGPNKQEQVGVTPPSQYDKTVGDTRVVLLAVSSVNLLVSSTLPSVGTNSTFLELTFLVEHVGTNAFSTTIDAQPTLYLQDPTGRKPPLSPKALFTILRDGAVCDGLPAAKVKVANPDACHIHHVFFHGLEYPPGVRATCVVPDGFDGHTSDFRFEIFLPNTSVTQ